ncbi:MAG: hypothetical protein QOJ91_120 [Sphingomonadales bacterium]|jgi:hypothetical protein|nr:hypothetical protein [Sphingomonadales bacterium]
MRSMVEGFFQRRKNPSTALRAVPLPAKSREEFQLRIRSIAWASAT